MKMIGLREIRKKKGLSQLKVAMDLSISREALSYYENGKRSPDIAMLVKMSAYFNASIDYLIRGKEFEEIVLAKEEDESIEIPVSESTLEATDIDTNTNSAEA